MMMSVDTAIISIVEGMLPVFSPIDKALLMRLDVSSSLYHPSMPRGLYRNRTVNLLFYRHSNYTLVLSRVQRKWESMAAIYDQTHMWIRESYHDSCWRSDGLAVLHMVGNELEERVRRIYWFLVERLKLFRNDLPNYNIITRVSFHTFDGAPHFVNLKVGSINNDGYILPIFTNISRRKDGD